jgi:hypothetical protein
MNLGAKVVLEATVFLYLELITLVAEEALVTEVLAQLPTNLVVLQA